MKWKKVKEIAPMYVIGALDEKMAQKVEASLRSATAEQRRVVARWRDVAALLPQALPLQTPPDYLRERLLNRIVEGTQQTPIEIAVEESSLLEVAGQDERNVLPFVHPRRAEPRTSPCLLIPAPPLPPITPASL